MKKVLFVATVTKHINTFHIPYLKLFQEKEYEVHVASNGDKKIEYCDKHFNLQFERSPFKLSNIKVYKELKRIIDENKYEIIHCHTPVGGVLTRLAARKARKKYGTRVIYTAHGFHFYKGASLLNWLLFYPVEWYLAKYTDTLITINKEDYERAKKKFGKRCKDIQYVPGVGIDTEKFQIKLTEEEKDNLRKEIGITKDNFILTCVGRLDKNKNQGFLIKCMEQLVKDNPNIHLLLAGRDELNGRYQTLAKSLKLENNVHFLGNRDDVPKLLKITDIVVSASRREGLPVNIIEAFAAGIPVVALKCRGIDDVIKNSLNGCIIKNENLKEFEEKILVNYNNIINNEEIKKTVEKYHISILLEKYKKIYLKKKKIIIIPNCTDLNRGDQALVLETKRIIEQVHKFSECYMMSSGDTQQCENYGLIRFSDILKHPSRFSKKNANVKYGVLLKIKWGFIAIFDLIYSSLILNKFFRRIICVFSNHEIKNSISLFESCDYVFVKGGGFLHDYSGSLTGIYTMYYQTYHIRLALALNKKVYIMPNSYGPFKSNISKKMVNGILNRCTLVTARESISANGKTNGLDRDIMLFPDLGFFLQKKKDNLNISNLLNNLKIDTKNDDLVAITVRPYRFYSSDNPSAKYFNYKKTFAEFIEYLIKKNYKILLVVHTSSSNDHENDEKCLDEILNILEDRKNVYKIKNNDYDCYDLKELYGYCKYVIGTRFHSVIFSLEQLIPCIAVTYGGNKGDGIMKDIGIEKMAIKIGEMDINTLIDKFDDLEKNHEEVKQKIENYIMESQENYKDLLKKIGELS